MPRPAQPLKAKYGKLSVFGERRVDGRRVASVLCDCGTKKDVYADALLTGRTRSCGSHECRRAVPDPKAPKVKTYRPSGTRAVPINILGKCWKAYSDIKQPASGVELASLYDINKNTLYAALRSVRLAGGWEKYLTLVQKKETPDERVPVSPAAPAMQARLDRRTRRGVARA